ncbi:MAG: hypothetical protein RL385_5952 [Pseudomonadota bacterium]|jgi:hypothetical protein
MSQRFTQRQDVAVAVATGLIYGVSAQLAVRLQLLQGLHAVMSFGYVFVLPAVLGIITALSLRPGRRWWESVGAALLTTALSLAVAFAVGWEGTICVVMAAPVYFTLAVLGALLGHFSRGRGGGPSQRGAVIALLGMPLASAGIESRLPAEKALRTVHTQIDIRAPRQEVWRQIVRVPAIHEPQEGWFFRMGFPRPVEATLSHEGVGGVRHASFERGLLFVETITAWEPEQHFRFSIAVDPAHTPLTTLDAHVTVGGQYFDVLDGGYRIEALDAEHVRLHLDSKHRISTRFNAYTSLWSDALMGSIQENILRVIRARAEARASRETASHVAPPALAP